MTLDQLHYFCAVCQHGGVTCAANALNISQPSVSAAIKNLEQEFHTPLFHRQRKRLILTPAGQQLLSMSAPLLREADALVTSMHALREGCSVVRLGVPPMIGSLVLPRLYSALPLLSPHLQIQVFEDDSSGLRKLLSEGKVDMSLLPHTHPFDSTLTSLSITQLQNVCCVQKGHPLSCHSRISIAELCDQPLVLFKNSFFQTERILAAFRSLGCQPNVVLHTAQLSTVQNMIAGGSAIGFLFSFLAEKEDGVVGIPLDPPMTTQVSLVWNRNHLLTEAMESLVSYFKDNRF